MERYLSKISWENAHVRNYDMAEFVMQCSDFICFISLIFKYHYISKDAKTGYLVDFEYKPKRVNPTSHVFMVNNQVKYDSIWMFGIELHYRCCIQFFLIVWIETIFSSKCVHNRFSNPVTNSFASGYVQMVLSTRHILQNLNSFATNICVVFIFVLVTCLQIQKYVIFSPCKRRQKELK